MLKQRKEFCKWIVKYGALSLAVRKLLEQEFAIKAKQFGMRQGLKPDEFVVTMVKCNAINFSFVITLK